MVASNINGVWRTSQTSSNVSIAEIFDAMRGMKMIPAFGASTGWEYGGILSKDGYTLTGTPAHGPSTGWEYGMTFS